jgi:site-specific DNA-methyltransferase (adenine-specific)
MIYAQANELLLLNGDCIELMKVMPDNCVDSIVTDPPYGISFMGKAWDNARMLAKGVQGLDHNKDNRRSANQHAGTYDTSYSAGLSFQLFSSAWATEALRVLKPGGHLLSFSSSRTYHRMTSGIEDAGFEIRDQIMWLYGSGFPKSLDVSKAIDKAAGAERERVLYKGGIASGQANYGGGGEIHDGTKVGEIAITAAAKEWQGWGTALKPAHEPIVVARKPLEGTVANNVLTHGVGGLNIDGSRVGFGEEEVDFNATQINIDAMGYHGAKNSHSTLTYKKEGRWPANVIHDGSDEVVKLFPDSNAPKQYNKTKAGWLTLGSAHETNELQSKEYGDTGSAARFFYCAKTSKNDRHEGLEEFEKKQLDESRKEGNPGGDNPRNRGVNAKSNFHPTVKPTELMRYLVRLLTPPNGIVLDPFTGSGSTGKACMLEDFNFIGIDLSQEYLEIAKARIAFALENKSYELFK